MLKSIISKFACMSADFNQPVDVEPDKKETEVVTDQKLSVGVKVILSAIVVGTVVAGVYLALTLTR